MSGHTPLTGAAVVAALVVLSAGFSSGETALFTTSTSGWRDEERRPTPT